MEGWNKKAKLQTASVLFLQKNKQPLSYKGNMHKNSGADLEKWILVGKPSGFLSINKTICSPFAFRVGSGRQCSAVASLGANLSFSVGDDHSIMSME
jgi:hypothetical protein